MAERGSIVECQGGFLMMSEDQFVVICSSIFHALNKISTQVYISVEFTLPQISLCPEGI
jgi:hypothetical protein